MQLMILNDGETYTSLAGCAIIDVPDGSDPETIEALLDAEGSAGSPIRRVFTFSDTFEPPATVREAGEPCTECGATLELDRAEQIVFCPNDYRHG